MGNRVLIAGANYTNNVNSDFIYDFDIKSDHVTDVSYVGNILSFRNFGVSGNYETLGNSQVKNATITCAVDAPIGSFAVGLGILSDGNYAFLYLNNVGTIRKFWKDGHVATTLLYTTPSPYPNVPKGSPVTVVHGVGKVTISYPGYSRDILYTDIPDFATPMIGVLATGLLANTHTFIVN